MIFKCTKSWDSRYNDLICCIYWVEMFIIYLCAEMNYQYFTKHIFPCGLRFAFKRSSSQVAYCALNIKTGTRSEEPEFNGLAHLTEHMLFKGTVKRSSKSINNLIDSLGGELNAYTNKEETVLHTTVLKEDIAKAIDILFEIAFTSLFDEKELQKEKIVVADEINSYKDSPSEQIFDDFEEYLLEGSPLAMPVLGTIKSLKKIKSEHIKGYVSSFFIPENMSFSVVADIDEKDVIAKLNRSLRRYIIPNCIEENEASVRELTSKDVITGEQDNNPLSVGTRFVKEVTRRNHQVHCIMGCTAYSLYDDPERLALILLINILGGPAANSRLNMLLREREGLVYTIEANYNQYSDTGVVTIYFGCDKVNIDKCITSVKNELKKVRDVRLTESALKTAKKQLLGQLAISSDNGESQCMSMGKSLLVFNDILDNDQIRVKIEAITSDQIHEVANAIFAPERMSVLIYK